MTVEGRTSLPPRPGPCLTRPFGVSYPRSLWDEGKPQGKALLTPLPGSLSRVPRESFKSTVDGCGRVLETGSRSEGVESDFVP